MPRVDMPGPASSLVTEPSLTPHWVIGDTLETLSRIAEPGVTLCVARREFSPALRMAVDAAIHESIDWSWRGELDRTMRADLRLRLPAIPALEALFDDVVMLSERIAALFDTSRISVRLKRLEQTQCPRFHVDNLTARFLTTYAGLGTQWLPDAAADRRGLGAASVDKPDIVQDSCQIRRLDAGDLACFKGSAWPGNAGGGLIHRSPPGERLVLTIDPR